MVKEKKKIEQVEKFDARKGFDNPLANFQLDLLDRRCITQQVYSHLTDLESEWSIRVGLLAPWGEGKTTICRWIIEKAKADGHIPVLYSPYSAKTDSELWFGLYSSIMATLTENKIELKDAGRKQFFKGLASKIANNKIIEEASKYTDVTNIGLGILQKSISFDQGDIQYIAKQLNS